METRIEKLNIQYNFQYGYVKGGGGIVKPPGLYFFVDF